MRGIRVLAAAACVLAAAIGCGKGGGVKKGERFEVLQDTRLTAVTEWEEPYTDGFETLIPKGTIVEARFATTPSSVFFECVPVEVKRNKSPMAITQFFVPEGIRTREGFKGFFFSLPVADIGTKLKRLSGN